eukprot:CAMPEP_0204561410 /NCGR_PEP_ID=MMETSP0661-20131031/33171_1 /ASSEMBLY_ACC=CAM_ASM_000606 /TAXON_ID=109239 /ORGANISM="Alexandrium margalefi, Strain AMGDE01CS-322" /LENGTH=46 /DNA_ID= /DNA_START= /DNA_END= /DNA_ORIENTATION=
MSPHPASRAEWHLNSPRCTQARLTNSCSGSPGKRSMEDERNNKFLL